VGEESTQSTRFIFARCYVTDGYPASYAATWAIAICRLHGYPHHVKPQKESTMSSALLLIDIQNDYFPGGSMALEGADEAGAQAGKLLAAFRRAGQMVIHIQHLSLRPGSTFFLPGTPGAEIHACVAPQADEPVIEKHYPNSFRETTLMATLKEKGVDELVIAGMMTHMCVDATVRAAFDFGLRCRVAHDACATRALVFNGETIPAAHVHGAFLAALQGIYATLGSVAEVSP
jgi:nicotinamidase-related amidase